MTDDARSDPQPCALQTGPSVYGCDPGYPNWPEALVVAHSHADGTIHFESLVVIE
jgi:hypothetical protein